jgi:hypothetical protein
MDLITGLPMQNGKDTILTIVDHGCSRAALFLSCTTTITGLAIAQLYLDNVYRWFGLPTKVISDRDPRFTSHFGRALTQKLGIYQNLFSAFHPKPTESRKGKTNGSNNTFDLSPRIPQKIEPIGWQSQRRYTTIDETRPRDYCPIKSYLATSGNYHLS